MRVGTDIRYEVITKDVSDYINLLVIIAHIICNHPYFIFARKHFTVKSVRCILYLII
jgi:hypothetical protein